MQFFICLAAYSTIQRPIMKQAGAKKKANKHIHQTKGKTRQLVSLRQ
jgi:hypothetical protein